MFLNMSEKEKEVKNSNLLLLFLFSGLLILHECGGKTKPFKINSYDTIPNKVASKYILSKGVENLNAYDFKKVAIIEFNVEYLVNMPDSLYVKVTDELYKIFVNSIRTSTDWNVIDKNEVIKSSVFSDLRKKLIKRNVAGKGKDKTVSITYPTSGLGIFSSTEQEIQSILYNGFDRRFQEPALLEDISAAAALKVHTIINYIRKGENGRVVIVPSLKDISSSTKVDIFIGYSRISISGEKYMMSYDKEHFYKYKGHCSFLLDKAVVSYESITAKPGTFDLEEFVYWTKEMFKIYSEMLAIEISQNL